jgi:hypothetical protein
MTLLLALITLLCNGTISATGNAAAADVKTAASVNASFSMADLQAITAGAATSFASGIQSLDELIAAAAGEPDMKVGSSTAHVLSSGLLRSQTQTSWSALTKDQMRKGYDRIARRGYPRLVTSPDELIAHVVYAVDELAEHLEAEAKTKGIALGEIPESKIQEICRALLRCFIAFPEGPTMYDIVQMARARYLESYPGTSPRVTGIRKMLGLLDQHARFQLREWMKANKFSEEMIKSSLGASGEFELFPEAAVARQSVKDPAAIFKLIEEEVRLFSKSNAQQCGYGDVYNIASKVMRAIKLPEDETAIASMSWVNTLFHKKYSDKPATPSSSLCCLIMHHMKQVYSQRIYVLGYSPDAYLQETLKPAAADVHFVAADKKLFHVSHILNTSKCLFDCYAKRFEMLRKFLQGKAVLQGEKTHQLEKPFLSVQDYLAGQIDAVIEAPQNPRTANPGMVHGYALLDLAVAQDPVDIITAYCTEPGWSIEYAAKMEEQGSFLGPLVKTERAQGYLFLYLDRRGFNSLKGFGSLRDAKCDVLEVKYNLLAELTAPLLKPLTRCPGLQLKCLSLSNNNLSLIDFAELANIRTLTNLTVANNELTRVDGIAQLVPQLTLLDISNNRLHESLVPMLVALWWGKSDSNLIIVPQRKAPEMSEKEQANLVKQTYVAGFAATQSASTDQKKKLRQKRDKARRPNGE